MRKEVGIYGNQFKGFYIFLKLSLAPLICFLFFVVNFIRVYGIEEQNKLELNFVLGAIALYSLITLVLLPKHFWGEGKFIADIFFASTLAASIKVTSPPASVQARPVAIPGPVILPSRSEGSLIGPKYLETFFGVIISFLEIPVFPASSASVIFLAFFRQMLAISLSKFLTPASRV